MKEEIDYEVSEPKEEERVYVTPSADENNNDNKWQTKIVIGLIIVATIVAVISLISLVK